MIQDEKVAKEIARITLESRINLSQSVRYVKDNCSKEEATAYERAMARIVGYLILDVMEPLYEQHPELRPEALKN